MRRSWATLPADWPDEVFRLGADELAVLLPLLAARPGPQVW